MFYLVIGFLLFGALLIGGGFMFHSIALLVSGGIVMIALVSFFAQLSLRS